ncbi:hypothetical protein GWK47_014761 [Chionoecetes opilio]|uniref:Uncharacterized protein n=1 Tax=Chionoecetes opilio TaxID=41210 RepID=A0A8J4XZW1_CHIOP|nr:hypothetical protein GWK47_014761 [Chionoecetes opilio]
MDTEATPNIDYDPIYAFALLNIGSDISLLASSHSVHSILTVGVVVVGVVVLGVRLVVLRVGVVVLEVRVVLSQLASSLLSIQSSSASQRQLPGKHLPSDSHLNWSSEHSLKDEGHDVRQSIGDADTQIVLAALEYASKEDKRPVTVVANDTDILVLLMFHWEAHMNIFMLSDAGKKQYEYWDIASLVEGGGSPSPPKPSSNVNNRERRCPSLQNAGKRSTKTPEPGGQKRLQPERGSCRQELPDIGIAQIFEETLGAMGESGYPNRPHHAEDKTSWLVLGNVPQDPSHLFQKMRDEEGKFRNHHTEPYTLGAACGLFIGLGACLLKGCDTVRALLARGKMTTLKQGKGQDISRVLFPRTWGPSWEGLLNFFEKLQGKSPATRTAPLPTQNEGFLFGFPGYVQGLVWAGEGGIGRGGKLWRGKELGALRL